MKGSKETITEISDNLAKKYIEQEIQMWAIKYPEDAKLHVLDMHETLKSFDSIGNPTGSSTGKNMRWGLRIPITLTRMLEKRFPAMFTNKKEFRWFMREFPNFRIPRKI